MAQVTITIEDLPNGGVKVVATPNLETMFKMLDSGNDLTASHGYAFTALNAIKKASNEKDPLKIIVPRQRGW